MSTYLQIVKAARPINGDEWLKKQHISLLESLPRGPVPPSTSSPCTYIPGGGGSGSCLNGRNFAGVGTPPAFPSAVVNFAAASENNESNKQDSVS